MSILTHPQWSTLRPFFHIETYDRDGGHRHPRHRIEVRATDDDNAHALLDVTMPCVACGHTMHPIRARNGGNTRGRPRHLYFAACCPLDVNLACCRGDAARHEYEAIVAECGRHR